MSTNCWAFFIYQHVLSIKKVSISMTWEYIPTKSISTISHIINKWRNIPHQLSPLSKFRIQAALTRCPHDEHGGVQAGSASDVTSAVDICTTLHQVARVVYEERHIAGRNSAADWYTLLPCLHLLVLLEAAGILAAPEDTVVVHKSRQSIFHLRTGARHWTDINVFGCERVKKPSLRLKSAPIINIIC